ncbi:hypothetical protein QBC38DRAFT_391217 [Podospora fimiseda]|uniref:Uncharacterized protein n=1 Tax=Podospora fimiseda TaxID=252190 RepID=A0AAN7GYX8_9PEZI|nr:hypothetical protein QBC38DRAFT_391217 [Podospora fimiseda]
MISAKQGSIFLLQAAGLFSGAAARCLRTCPTDDPLLGVLRAEGGAEDFCRTYLGLPVSTITAIVTPSIVPTITETAYVTESVTVIDATETVTITASSSAAPVIAKRDLSTVEYPDWLGTTYGTKYVSSACACLSVAPSVATITSTADAVTITGIEEYVTVTETTTSTVLATATAVVTLIPEPPKPITRVVKIEALRKDNGVSEGWLYDTNGVAITTEDRAATFRFTLSGGAKTGSAVRITADGISGALGFNKDSHPSNIVELENGYGTTRFVEPTPPGSVPQTTDAGKNKYASDIWIVDTEAKTIGWQWIATSGQTPNIDLYRNGGRIYPVGNYDQWSWATSNSIGQKYPVTFRYKLLEEFEN